MAVIAEGASIRSGGLLDLYGVFTRLTSGQFPFVVPRMYLAYSISVPTAEHLNEVFLQVDLVDPDGHVLHTVVRDRRLLGGCLADPSTFSFTVEIRNIAFGLPGDYQFSMMSNGAFFHAMPLVVAKRR